MLMRFQTTKKSLENYTKDHFVYTMAKNLYVFCLWTQEAEKKGKDRRKSYW